MSLDLSYGFCGLETEDINHILIGCFMAISLWVRLTKRDKMTDFLSVNLQDQIHINLSKLESLLFARLIGIFFLVFIC